MGTESAPDFSFLQELYRGAEPTLGRVYYRRKSGYATAYEVLTENHKLWLDKLSRKDAVLIVTMVNAIPDMLAHILDLKLERESLRQEINSFMVPIPNVEDGPSVSIAELMDEDEQT